MNAVTAASANEVPGDNPGEISVRTSWGDSPTEIVPGTAVHLPLTFTATVGGLPAELRGTVNLVGDRLACTQLEVVGAPGEAVTSDRLRQVPVAALTALAVRGGLVNVSMVDDGRLRVTTPSTLRAPEGFPAAGPTREALQYVALTYRLAYMLGGSPTKAVAALGMPYATAARWVSRARKAKLLDPTARGRAGGVTAAADYAADDGAN